LISRQIIVDIGAAAKHALLPPRRLVHRHPRRHPVHAHPALLTTPALDERRDRIDQAIAALSRGRDHAPPLALQIIGRRLISP
jgi:hypothetical protein